jgi:hypothetical protein
VKRVEDFKGVLYLRGGHIVKAPRLITAILSTQCLKGIELTSLGFCGYLNRENWRNAARELESSSKQSSIRFFRVTYAQFTTYSSQIFEQMMKRMRNLKRLEFFQVSTSAEEVINVNQFFFTHSGDFWQARYSPPKQFPFLETIKMNFLLRAPSSFKGVAIRSPANKIEDWTMPHIDHFLRVRRKFMKALIYILAEPTLGGRFSIHTCGLSKDVAYLVIHLLFGIKPSST